MKQNFPHLLHEVHEGDSVADDVVDADDDGAALALRSLDANDLPPGEATVAAGVVEHALDGGVGLILRTRSGERECVCE